jgi:hypothetical protein
MTMCNDAKGWCCMGSERINQERKNKTVYKTKDSQFLEVHVVVAVNCLVSSQLLEEIIYMHNLISERDTSLANFRSVISMKTTHWCRP